MENSGSSEVFFYRDAPLSAHGSIALSACCAKVQA
jgi:hypothetical protein